MEFFSVLRVTPTQNSLSTFRYVESDLFTVRWTLSSSMMTTFFITCKYHTGNELKVDDTYLPHKSNLVGYRCEQDLHRIEKYVLYQATLVLRRKNFLF